MITDEDRLRAEEIADTLQATLENLHDLDREVVLAALAHVAAQRILEDETERELV